MINGGLSLLVATKRCAVGLTVSATLICAVVPAQAADKKPNILFIMGDDIGMWNIGAYSRGMMAGRTPNLDKMAKEGMLFTDYYAAGKLHWRVARTSSPANYLSALA